jgi:hypothetical protein
MKSIIASLLLAALPAVSTGWAQTAWMTGDMGLLMDSTDRISLEGSKGEIVTVAGRVVESRLVEGRALLILDGGLAGVLLAKGSPEPWKGKLIESKGLLLENPRPTPGVPSLIIQQQGPATVRIIPESLSGLASVLVQEVEPGEKFGGYPDIPPLPALSEAECLGAASLSEVNDWKRNDGSVVRKAYDYFYWRQRLAPDFKTRQWVVSLRPGLQDPPQRFSIFPEDLNLIPEDQERLRRMLWKEYHRRVSFENASKKASSKVAGPASDAMAETVDWVARLETWGSVPAADEKGAQRIPGPIDFGNLPDIRQLILVRLTRPSPLQRTYGRLQVIDWAMTGESSASMVKAQIRWEDGVEETLPALDLVPNLIFKQSGRYAYRSTTNRSHASLLFMMDWYRSRQSGKTLPGAELKFRALRQFLHYWWNSGHQVYLIASEKAKPQTEPQQAAAAIQANRELALPSKFGHRLPFPRLAPNGYGVLPNDQADRSRIIPWEDKPGGTNLRGMVPVLAATLRWWADSRVIQLPERLRDNPRRDVMLLAAVERYPEPWKIAKYFFENSYAIQHLYDTDYSPENLARYAVGCHAVILDVDVYDERKLQFRQKMLIHTAAADGSVEFSIWGQKGSGRFKPIPLHATGKRPASAPPQKRECYQLEITGPAELTAYMASRKYRFVLDDWTNAEVQILTPWISTGVPPGR